MYSLTSSHHISVLIQLWRPLKKLAVVCAWACVHLCACVCRGSTSYNKDLLMRAFHAQMYNWSVTVWISSGKNKNLPSPIPPQRVVLVPLSLSPPRLPFLHLSVRLFVNVYNCSHIDKRTNHIWHQNYESMLFCCIWVLSRQFELTARWIS